MGGQLNLGVVRQDRRGDVPCGSTSEGKELERFRKTRRLFESINGGLFLRKTRRERVLPVYAISETAIVATTVFASAGDDGSYTVYNYLNGQTFEREGGTLSAMP